jgi:inner membrane protein
MTGRTHDLAAITTLGMVFVFSAPSVLTLSTVLVCILANLIGGITPDLDQPTAPFWRNLPVGNIFGKLFSRMSGGHRFLTHSIIGVIAIGYVANLFLAFLHPIMGSVDTNLVWLAFMLGVASHLAMDFFTKEGVPLLLPIPVKFGLPPFRRMRITTGKHLETWVVFPALVFINIVFYSMYHAEVIELIRRIS